MKIEMTGFREFLQGEIFEIVEKRKDQLRPVEDIGQEELAYLAGMLARFIDASHFLQHYTSSPLYDLALRQNSNAPKTALIGLGDFCLFRTGFFPLGFKTKRTAPRKNFVLAGQKAYLLVSESQNQTLEMFRSLALNFLIFSNLLSEIRLRYMTDRELMDLYDFWLETGSEFAEEILRMRGVSPMRLDHIN